MATQTDPSALPRVPLTRERVLRAAIALADQAGTDGLSMRRLGERLQVEAMSLYNHVANKSDLLDGMVDLVFSEISLASGRAGWKRAMRDRAISAREALRRHPWATSLMQSRTRPGPATLRHHNWVIGKLRQAGFDIEMAAHAFSAIDGYVYGFALQQANMPIQTPEQVVELGANILRQHRAAELPYLAEMIDYATKPGYDYGKEFEFGLDVVLDGLEGRLHMKQGSRSK
ncbi:MAG TPA: TetR/AcrR family transcriptional regulator [Candidatus Dormibacteraeota bacterium]|nr:TetR/AcrR family transcriptional regulator [Candidatus Dormibacteraeota bacterium]